MSIAAGTRLGPYEIVAPLGAGGMGEVYRAKDIQLGRDVALKVLSPALAGDAQYMARFEREAQVLASLNHPNIAILHGLQEDSGVRALVMELVEGPTLAERIALGPIPLEEALPIARQIAEALETAHERGIIHRDLKPANVKLTHDGVVKVLDFGLAKALDDDTMPSGANSPTITMSATRAGVILGTAAYMSPEQAKGKRVDRRSDVWAFGVVLYEMLTGHPMYSGETAAETLAFVMTKDPALDALPASTPISVRHLLLRCLQRDPRLRLQAIGEARILLSEDSPAAPTPSSVPSAWRTAAFVTALGFALLALAVLAFVHFREIPPEALLSRFTIPSPEKAAFFPNNPIISPDGRRLAFIATSEGRQLLWVRPLESVAAQPLPGTDGAILPFWSADSRFIAFSAGSKLRKIDVAGGPPQTLCDVQPFALGGTWGRDGTIIFGTNSGLFSVSSAGGVPVRLTSVDSSRQERGHEWPQFLPDDRHFIYLAASNQPENAGIYLASRDSPKDRKQLVRTPYNAVYAPALQDARGPQPGHLLFMREGTLMAQAFDEKRWQPAGEAIPVAEQVGVYLDLAFFSVSKTGVLAYRGGAGQMTQLVWFDRSGRQLQTVGPAAENESLALSPDETRVAVTRQDGRNRDIWLIDLARDSISRFTFDEAADQMPVWSPDGSRIAFASLRDGPASLYQKISSGAGKDELLLKSSGINAYPDDWSRDGRYLLYTTIQSKGGFDIFLLPMDGDRKAIPFVQSQFREWEGQFSPDAKFIAYCSDESGRPEIYVQSFPVSGAKWMISAGGGVQPRWRRDGKEIFYLSLDRKLMAVEVKTAGGLEVASAKPLFQTRIGGSMFSVSGGSRYVASANGQRFLINSVPVEAASAPVTLVLNWTASLKK
jgi:eukaryotic-like serine/threonine-protein kinase